MPPLQFALLGLLVLLTVLLLVIAIQPAEFRIERFTAIAAPPSAVFPFINDLRRWESWSPWEKVDPNVKKTYGGAAEGPGATYAWEGNSQVGKGDMVITESKPNELIRLTLNFQKPMKATNTVEFTLDQLEDGGTIVTETMTGRNSFMGKAMGMVMNMDSMIGKQFEKGLADLKSEVEVFFRD